MKAAIWWRVSTEGQKEISPETQIAEALAFAKQEGYEVPQEYIIGTDWHSLSVWDSPALERLKELIRSQAISGVFMYDADRGPSKPAHRLLFRALCEEYGIVVRCKYGQVPDGEMGEVMEFLSAWGKEVQVKRTQQGARDGLRDRARLKGLPVNGKAPYGYRLRYETLTEGSAVKHIPTAYEPDSATYPVITRIWKEALAGTPLRGICRNLMDASIPTARGGVKWDASTIFSILRNPIYGGRYYALRHEAVKAKQPKVTGPHKREKGSVAHRDLTDAVLLDFLIVSPPVSWTQWEAVQERLKQNKTQSQRNSKNFYLLSGMLYCARDGRRLRPKRYKKSYYYACSLRKGEVHGHDGCDLGSVNGPVIEGLVWQKIFDFFNDEEVFMAEMERQQGASGQGQQAIEATIQSLQEKVQKVDSMETELVGLRMRDKFSDVAFERNLALLKAERTHYQDEIERQSALLATVQHQTEALQAMIDLRERVAAKEIGSTPEEHRSLLQDLQTRIIVSRDGIRVTIGVHDSVLVSVNNTRVLPLGNRSKSWWIKGS